MGNFVDGWGFLFFPFILYSVSVTVLFTVLYCGYFSVVLGALLAEQFKYRICVMIFEIYMIASVLHLL